jgi:6-phosphogluconolactonase
VAVDLTARFAYVTNRGSDNVSGYSIASNGVLTPVPGSPFAAGGGPISVAADPTAKFVYAANIDSNNVTTYSIGSDGALTPVPGSPFAARVKPVSVAITRLLPPEPPHKTDETVR